MSRLIIKILKFLPSLLIIAICMPVFVVGTREIGKYLGLVSVPVQVVGTGSMYPSLYWDKAEGGPDDAKTNVVDESRTTPHMYKKFAGISFACKKYLETTIGYGDMVAFESDKTRSILEKEHKNQDNGFIKRVIGVPGDKVELRDGFVIKNGKTLDEPYINSARSTYGDASIPECKILSIPEDSYLVMGDNRKVSNDSRGELGLVKGSDISYVLPLTKQGIYHSLWRDTSADQSLAGTATLDKQKFYLLLNAARKARGISELKVNPKLEKSASTLASESLKGNKGYNMASSMSSAGYSNIITSEFSIRGRFTAQELLQNLLYFENTASHALDADLQDIGVADIEAEVNGCPTEMIVGHMGGYIPAQYDEKTVQSWKELRDNLAGIIPSWEKAVQYEGIDQAKLAELLTIYQRRLALAKEVVSTMEAKMWFSDNLDSRIKADDQDAKKAEELAKSLNGE